MPTRSFILALLMITTILITACQPAGQPIPPTSQPTTQPTVTPLIPTLTLTNAILIDGTGAAPISDAVIVIQGEKILAAGPRAKVQIPDGSQVIDLQGATILPGFINAHVHQGFNAENLKAWAQGGVTTIRDEGTGPASTLKEKLDQRTTTFKDPQYARIISAGVMLTIKGGYGQQEIDDTPEAARNTVLQELEAGVDLIKISREDGYAGTSGLPKMSDETVKALVALAHQRGYKVSGHITRARYLEELVALDVDDIAHTPYDLVSDDAIQQMVDKGISLNTTISVLKNYGAPLDMAVDNIRRFHKAGGMVVLGNDYGGGRDLSDFELGIPMFELQQMQEAGMTPMEIILASTQNAAIACDKLTEIGTVEAGKFADLLIISGDPLKDLQALTQIQMVIHRGAIIRGAE